MKSQYYIVIIGDNARLSYKVHTRKEALESSYGGGLPESSAEIIPVGGDQNKAVKKWETLMKKRKLTGH